MVIEWGLIPPMPDRRLQEPGDHRRGGIINSVDPARLSIPVDYEVSQGLNFLHKLFPLAHLSCASKSRWLGCLVQCLSRRGDPWQQPGY
jgi:hypothetical protein